MTNLGNEKALSEVAINNQGQMYVYSEEGGITTISPTEYYNNRENYQAITNSQLMSLRSSQAGLAFNDNILDHMQDAVGMMTITNHLRSVIKDFGSTQVEGYTEKRRDDIESGFEQLLTGGPEGFYKYMYESQLNREGGERAGMGQNVNMAIDYLYSQLPENMKALLRAKTAAEGMNPNSGDARKLLVMALMEHTSDTQKVSFDNVATNSGSGSGSSATVDKSYIENVATVGPMAYQDFNITPANSKITMTATGQNFSRPITRTDNPVGQNNVAALFGMIDGIDGAYAFSVGDRTSVSFGDNLIASHDLNKLL
jgi:hypothetical protein